MKLKMEPAISKPLLSVQCPCTVLGTVGRDPRVQKPSWCSWALHADADSSTALADLHMAEQMNSGRWTHRAVWGWSGAVSQLSHTCSLWSSGDWRWLSETSFSCITNRSRAAGALALLLSQGDAQKRAQDEGWAPSCQGEKVCQHPGVSGLGNDSCRLYLPRWTASHQCSGELGL